MTTKLFVLLATGNDIFVLKGIVSHEMDNNFVYLTVLKFLLLPVGRKTQILKFKRYLIFKYHEKKTLQIKFFIS
jgi:hypothetical protein